MDKDMEFIDDPIFKGLKNFAASTDDAPEIPSDIAYTFRNAGIRSTRRKVLRRSVFTIITASVVLPSLSFAHVLPAPIDNVVKSVVHLVAAPVRAINNVINDPAPAPTPSPSLTADPVQPSPSPTPTAEASTPAPTPSQTQVPVPTPTPTPIKSSVPAPAPKPAPSKPVISGGGGDDEEVGERVEHETVSKLPSTPTLPNQSKPVPSIAGDGKGESHSEVKKPETEGGDD